ncbi:antitoxin VapB family protein [Candidatus Woesearchaeota archaeon]|nr:antitoxin VapB family protein [Candidatus Woesearchaeota archaeon]
MTRVISLSDDAYELLKKLKRPGESFSKVVLRTYKKEEVGKKWSILDFFGKWPGPKEELDMIERMIEEDRKKTKMRDVRF